jgi:hypothetical protein
MRVRRKIGSQQEFHRKANTVAQQTKQPSTALKIQCNAKPTLPQCERRTGTQSRNVTAGWENAQISAVTKAQISRGPRRLEERPTRVASSLGEDIEVLPWPA